MGNPEDPKLEVVEVPDQRLFGEPQLKTTASGVCGAEAAIRLITKWLETHPGEYEIAIFKVPE